MAATPAAGPPFNGVTLLGHLAPTEPLSGHSRLVQRLRRRYADQLDLLPPGPPVCASMEATLATVRAPGLDTGAALRSLRQLVMERLVVLDCDVSPHQAPLQVITQAVTELAEIALDAACIHAFAQLDSQHGAPLASDGSRAQMWVVGMGKLGARELNVSSDIDLIYVYTTDGETAGQSGMPEGRGRTSNHEYFCKAVKLIYALVGDTTEHGFVFRVDLALRPHGNSGPVAVSLDALENYLQEQGREWERFAWLKSRVVAPRDCIVHASALRTVVLPFVFRRYLDYGVFDALRNLHQQIRDHSAKRSAGRPERANDVKLSRGGIREIEFTVQLLQVVRGGQFPELRTRPTLDALQCLAHAGLMPQATADALAQAYTFLRRVEHRIQYLDDQQTHVLPTVDTDLTWIAHSMGYAECSAFLAELDTHRELVAQEFDTLLGGKVDCKGCNGKTGKAGPGDLLSAPDLATLAENLDEPLKGRLLRWSTHARVQALRDVSRGRLSRLVQRTLAWLQEGRTSLDGVLRWMDWIEPLLRRESYLPLLLERPAIHQRLLRLLATAKWPARYLQQHPGVIDELASDAMLAERFVPAELEAELEARRAALQSTQEDDEETLLNLLRRAHHAELFRTLARDVEGRITVEQVADDLTALAEVILRVTARWCWQRLPTHHLDEPRFAVIGYGKLGGKELGYGSDLDIVFVHEDEDERAPEVYAQLVRKLINWLSVKTGEGDLFEIDTALRPNGNSGMLVTTLNAYASYQEGRGSNTAWTWEHQAMTRARCVLGPDSLRQRFDAIRQTVITAPRNLPALQAEIVAMRNKVRAAHPVQADAFDVKHSTGAMVDAEFAVQFLVLAHAAQYPTLQDNVGNIALLQRAEACGLLPAGVGNAAANAYRELRKAQHQARLNEAPTQVAPPLLQTERNAVLALWSAVFE